jgi:hypothetical protein
VSSSDEGLSGGGSDEEVVAGMFREEASKEKLGFESHWDSAVGAEELEAERGKSGNREDDTVGGYVSCPSPAAGKVAVVTGGEGSGEGSMAGSSVRAVEREGRCRWGPRLQASSKRPAMRLLWADAFCIWASFFWKIYGLLFTS